MVEVKNLPLSQIFPDSEQPRKEFDPEGLRELARSLKHNGLLQPIIVRPNGSGYVIIAGERRWRAAKELGWEMIPAIVRDDVTVEDAAKLQLLENITRRDLNPVERARAYKRFMEQGYTSTDIARITGEDAGNITYYVKILNCREDILHLVARGQVKVTLAYAIAKLSPDNQARVIREMTSRKMDTETAIAFAEKLYEQETQVDMFPELPRLSEEHRRAAQTFCEAFDRVCAVLQKLERMEEKQPGLMAQALQHEGEVTELKIKELIKHLNRLLRAMKATMAGTFLQEGRNEGKGYSPSLGSSGRSTTSC